MARPEWQWIVDLLDVWALAGGAPQQCWSMRLR